MTDQADTGERKKTSGSKLSLKRSGDSGQVRQNFSHGRSKSVVVERKKRRVVKPGEKPAATTKTAEPAQKPAAEKPAAEKPAAESAPAPAAEKPAAPAKKEAPREAREPRDTQKGGGKSRSGVVLRTLTAEEQQARERALGQARIREVEERKQAEIDAKRRAEEEVAREAERKEAEARAAEEALRAEKDQTTRKRAADDAKRTAEEAASAEPDVAKAEAEAARPATKVKAKEKPEQDEETVSKRPGAPAPTKRPAATRTEPRRRTGKLSINKALNDDGERQRSMASMRRRAERERKKAQGGPREAPQKVLREVTVPETITIQELANRMAERAVDVIKILMKQGMMVKINDVVDADTAQLIVEEMGHTVRRVAESDVEEGLVTDDDPEEMKRPRAPVVTVMGHVDHGKTSLLDALRKEAVAAGEAGGITQHIGAYQVAMESGKKITFLDTPGHAAFTSMRARGAKATDIVVLVVAADDGVMPQTIEAIDHAKAANVPMIIAINKMDKPEADPSRVKNELLQHEVITEDFGGDVLAVEISAKSGLGLDTLEETILLQAELLDLKANPDRVAEGVIVEAKLDKGRGPVGTVLIQRGTLHVGDVIVAGREWGRVRALINDRGENVDEAGPSEPVEVLGLGGAPEAGDVLSVVENEGRAREITDYRQRVEKDRRVAGARTSLDQMLSQLKEQDLKEVPILVKADVQGSAEAIVQAVEKLGNDEVRCRVIHVGVGGVTESDVTLATASRAPIIGFNVRANAQAREAARQADVEIRYYSVIYDLVDDIKAAMTGMLKPELRETFLGNAEILEVFHISKVGKVAGCRVTEGVVRRGSHVRLIRDDVVVHEGKLSTLKRFKDEVKEVQSGQECGMAFENYQDMRSGDVIECFDVEEIKRTLD